MTRFGKGAPTVRGRYKAGALALLAGRSEDRRYVSQIHWRMRAIGLGASFLECAGAKPKSFLQGLKPNSANARVWELKLPPPKEKKERRLFFCAYPALTHFVALRVGPQGPTYDCDAPPALRRRPPPWQLKLPPPKEKTTKTARNKQSHTPACAGFT